MSRLAVHHIVPITRIIRTSAAVTPLVMRARRDVRRVDFAGLSFASRTPAPAMTKHGQEAIKSREEREGLLLGRRVLRPPNRHGDSPLP